MEAIQDASDSKLFPDYDAEVALAKKFLTTFEGEGASFPYRDTLQSIANREGRVVRVALDDLEDWSARPAASEEEEEGGSSGKADRDTFYDRVEKNCDRYRQVFADAVQQALPEPDENAAPGTDVIDVLSHQRANQRRIAQERAQEPGGDGLSDGEEMAEPPDELMRRFEVHVAPRSSEKALSIREVGAACIGRLVTIKAMVTRVSGVRPLVAVATYTCDSCPHEVYQEVRNRQFMPLSECPSSFCANNRTRGRLQLQARGSKFRKFQELKIQELPGQVPMGHVPRTMSVHCHGELTRVAKPGDMVTLAGIFMPVRFSGLKALRAGLIADTYLVAQDIHRHKKNYDELEELDGDLEDAIEAIADQPDAFGRLARSIAPEIFGNEDVKKALLLMLTGGLTRALKDGMCIRGDIHICLMGDPGIAKSQLLKYIAGVAPRAVYTTGKGSSGVGLTAAVTRDQISGEMTLEGGALVLADRGICCIDEFDKMDDQDRTAIHEVMEQQTVSIAKAGITTTLNARTAVLAAANPLYGRYNKRRSISENVNLPNSLLSRFDLLFLLLDRVDAEADIALARHVTHVHRFKKSPGLQTDKPVPPQLLRYYIAQARLLEPKVPEALTAFLVEAYVSMRQQDKESESDQARMTPRQLLSVLRLATAIARLRFSEEVSQADAEEAIRLSHMSKASLFEDADGGGFGGVGGQRAEDPVTRIYSIIRDYATSQRLNRVPLATVTAMVVRSGFSEEQLDETLHEYEDLNILQISQDRTHLHYVV